MYGVLHDDVTDRALARYGYCVNDEWFQSETPLCHWHAGVELVVPLQGVATVHYNDLTVHVPPGLAVLGTCDIAHGAVGTFYRTVIHFDPDLLPVEGRAWLRDELASKQARQYRFRQDAIQRIVWVGQQLCDGRSNPPAPVVRGLLNMLLCELQAAEDGPGAEDTDILLRRIIHYMEEHVDRPENVDVLAERFDLSRSALTALFGEHLGTPPAEFWLRLRMERSLNLLARGLSVEHVAARVGFDSRAGFYRAFKRQYGVPPGQYRRIASST